MLFTRNFLQQLTILITTHHKYRILPELKEERVYSLYGHYHTHTWTLTPSEENFLDEFLKAL